MTGRRKTVWALPLGAALLGWLVPGANAADVGAEVPWVTYQAEDGATTGQKLSSRDRGEIANEAIGRACVKLAATGQYVEWKVTKPANGVVIRASVPDAPAGGGADYSLSLSVNGAFRQKLTVSSRHTWLYGTDANPQKNDPAAGPPHVYFDEAHALLRGAPLRPGDVLRVYKDAGDDAPWYVIDLIDGEAVPEAARQPANSLSVRDFGAIPDDGKDDSAALKACVEKARAEGKGVWIPAGTYHQTEPLLLDRITVRGAGPWYTRLTATDAPGTETFMGNVGIRLGGKDIDVADLAIDGTLASRTGVKQHGLTGSAQGFRIENLWIEHTDTGGWIGPCANGIVRRCRFRDTYADGLNVNNHSENIVLEQNHSRGNGDDGLAVYSGTDKRGAEGPCRNIVLRRNTVEGQWWGNGIAVYGGEEIVAERNRVESAVSGSGIIVSTGFKSWPTRAIRVVGNTLTDCGGAAWTQPWGALQLYVPGKDLGGLLVQDNTILRATNDGVKIMGGEGGGRLEATFSGNRIESPGGSGIHVLDSTRGQLTLQGNRISGLAAPRAELSNQAPAGQLSVTGS